MHPRNHLRDFRGILQADGYAGFEKLYNDANPNHPIKEAACEELLPWHVDPHPDLENGLAA